MLGKGGTMVRGIQLAELPVDIQKRFQAKNKAVPKKLVTLGKVLQLFKGMDRREALWILRRARKQFI